MPFPEPTDESDDSEKSDKSAKSADSDKSNDSSEPDNATSSTSPQNSESSDSSQSSESSDSSENSDEEISKSLFERGKAKARKLFEDVKSAFKTMKVVPRTLKLVWNASPQFTSFVILLVVVEAICPMATIWVGKLIVDLISETAKKADSFSLLPGLLLESKTINQLIQLLIWMAAIELLQSALNPLEGFVTGRLSKMLTRDISTIMIRKTNSLVDLTLFESPKFHDLMDVAQESDYRPYHILNAICRIIRSMVQFLIAGASFVVFQPLLFLFVLLSSIPSLVLQFKDSNETYFQTLRDTPESRKMYYFRASPGDRHMTAEIRMFGLGEFFLQSYMNAYESYSEKHLKLSSGQTRRRVLLALLSSASDLAVYCIIAFRTLLGQLSLGDFYLYSGALSRVQGSFSSAIWAVTSLYEDCLYVNKFFEFVDLKPTMKIPDPTWALKAPTPLKQGIEFRNVKFAYEGSNKDVLSNLSFKLEPGQKIALVGENGAGKTTIVKLLGRLYDPTEGEILVDGINLKEMDLDSWRAQIGVIFQNFVAYHLSAAGNIGIGQINFIEDELRIKAAAERGGASGFIEKLPKKYDTLLTSWFGTRDGSSELSGGEWQKVALSRLFMRAPSDGEVDSDDHELKEHLKSRSAQVLVLDEPTAALDVESEHKIYTKFQELTKDKMTLLISHRFSTVRMADLILMLNEGKIQEQGSHDELMALGGEYARLYKMQAERYQ